MSSHQMLCDIQRIMAAASSVLITGQGNPDGDSLGTQLALYDILVQQAQAAGKAASLDMVIANDEMPPGSYDFFPNVRRVVPVEQILDRHFEVGFILDASRDRIGRTLPLIERCRATINIDHHRNRAQSVDTIAWVEPEKSSTAEMVYDFFEHPDWRVTLTHDIAAGLYAAIIYDTGAFRYPSTSPRTHRIAAHLLEAGIDAGRIVEQMFLDKPVSALRLLTEVLHTLRWNPTGELIWGAITQALVTMVNAQAGDDDGLIANYAFTQGVKVAVLFKEMSATEVKVSFRSRGFLDVGRFARKLHAQGGGHPRAAGCTLHGDLHTVQTNVIQALEGALQAGGAS